jgi:hypothetical protein
MSNLFTFVQSIDLNTWFLIAYEAFCISVLVRWAASCARRWWRHEAAPYDSWDESGKPREPGDWA